MIRVYDHAMVGRHRKGYYGGSGFFNFGYWSTQAQSQREASEALVDQLLDRVVVKGGRILDVACGVGSSTRRLMDSYGIDMITGINISDAQIAAARKNAPGCKFIQMDATCLKFPNCHFDAIICVEAAFHFDTRDAFLREALRVLKPGGSLVLSDILFRKLAGRIVEFIHVPRSNLVPDIPSYRRRLEEAGFDVIDVQDATDACLGGFRRHFASWPAYQRKSGHMRIGRAIQKSILARAITGFFGLTCKAYVLVAALKPVLRQR